MYPLNTILDYFGNAEVCLGVVSKDQKERVQVTGATRQVTYVTQKQVISDFGVCTANNPLPAMVEIQNQINDQMALIDLELLWPALQEKTELTTLDQISAEYFGNGFSSAQRSAMARYLVADTLHFQRQGNNFIARSEEEAAEMERLRLLRAERAALKERIRVWLLSVIGANMEQCLKTPLAVPEEMETFIRQTADYLLRGFNCDAVNLLGNAPTKLTTREFALQVLKKTGRLPEGADEFLLSNGIHAGFADDVMEAVRKLVPYDSACGIREDLTHLALFSIDDESTREIDDALSCEVQADGTRIIGVHLANPSSFVHKDDVLDQVAVDRPLSLYLPTTTVTMFPEELGCRLASLNAEEIRPAMSLMLTVDDNNELVDWRFCQSQVKVCHRLTYDRADEILADESDDTPLRQTLLAVQAFGAARAALRAEAGAVSLNRPEFRIRVVNNEIDVRREEQNTPSHNLVAECMILANHLAAKYALRNDIPIIYRCQEMPLDDVHSVINYDPIDFDSQVRKMKRTRLSTYPDLHFGLGVDLYTQISSPLRRYADMVIQRQIASHLAGEPIPYTQQELFAVLDNVEAIAGRNRSLEREARKYWMLEYLRRNYLGTVMGATVVRLDGNLVLVELDEFFERGVLMTRDRPYIGDAVQVRITEIKPALGRMVLEKA